ncbi:MAG: hypothetical protein AAF657_21930 [Acidobacteriota bacterium]
MRNLLVMPAARASVALLCLAGVLTLACSDGSSSPTAPAPPTANTVIVANGQLTIPGGQPILGRNLHSRFAFSSTVPANLGASTGRVLSVVLQDAGNLAGCDSRCPSIDWADQGENFVNQVRVTTSAGEQTYFLTENRGLATTADPPSQV